MNQDANRSNRGKIAVFAIVGLLLGAAITYPIAHAMGNDTAKSSSSSSQVASTATKAAALRTTMNNLLRDHVTTNLTVTYNIVDKVPENQMQASIDAQTANAVAIANAVGSVYGDDAKMAITAPFVDHLTQSNNYAKAVVDGDTAAQASSLTALQADLRKIADIFHSVIPSLSSDTLYGALNDHETLMNQVAMEYQSGDYAAAYKTADQALTQISGGADAIAQGIVDSKPDMFKD